MQPHQYTLQLLDVQAGQPLEHAPSSYVTALLVPAGGAIDLDQPALEAMGIRSVPCPAHKPDMLVLRATCRWGTWNVDSLRMGSLLHGVDVCQWC